MGTQLKSYLAFLANFHSCTHFFSSQPTAVGGVSGRLNRTIKAAVATPYEGCLSSDGDPAGTSLIEKRATQSFRRLTSKFHPSL